MYRRNEGFIHNIGIIACIFAQIQVKSMFSLHFSCTLKSAKIRKIMIEMYVWAFWKGQKMAFQGKILEKILAENLWGFSSL